MSDAFLIDTTRCIGCRGCQVACKQQNGLPAEETEFFGAEGGYQNPADLSSKTFTLVTFNEVMKDDGELKWVFAKRQCMHCVDPSCASACIVGALQKTESGAVIYDKRRCIGCRYCMYACPFGVPTLEWDKLVPYIRKCTMCFDRRSNSTPPDKVNGVPLSKDSKERHSASQQMPACARACVTGAIKFGDRDKLLKEAKARINMNPDKYVHHIYGEHEAGGTSVLYLSSVPFEKLGFPTRVGTRSYPSYTHTAMGAIPYVILGVGTLLSGFYWVNQRRKEVEAAGQEGKE